LSPEKFCATTGRSEVQSLEVQESLNLEDLGRIATCTESLQSAWDNSQRCISFRLEDHVEHLGVIRGHIHSFGVSCLAKEKSFSRIQSMSRN